MTSRLCLLCRSEDVLLAFGFEIPKEDDPPDGLDAVLREAGLPKTMVPRTGSEATTTLIVRSTSDQ